MVRRKPIRYCGPVASGEAYLDTIGTSEEQMHPTGVHHLKHISDNNTVDYLDEKLVSRQR